MNELRDVEAFYRGVVGPEPHVPDGLLLYFLRGRATSAERERIELHLSACSRCREDAEALQRFAATLVTPAPTLRVSDEENLPLVSTRRRPPVRSFPVLPALFLVVNAIGLGAIAGLVAKPAPVTKPVPTPTATPVPVDLTRFRAAYESQLAKERNKSAQLEKQVRALKVGKPATKPVRALRSANETLPFPGDRGPVSLSSHPTLLWKKVANAEKYVATLLNAQGKPLLKATALGNDWRVATSLPRGASYQWRVVALGKGAKVLGKPQQGGVTVARRDEAVRIARSLKLLADQLEPLGFKTEADAARARAAMIMAK